MRLLIHLLLFLALALFVSLPATAQGIGDRLEDAKERIEDVKGDDDDKEDEDKEDKEDDDKEDKDDKEDDDKEDKED